MRLAGQRGQGGGDLAEGGADVGRGSAGVTAAVGVPGVGAGDGVAEIPLDPRQGGVPDPVHADLLGADPRQDAADPGPQAVIAAGGDRPPVGVAQQLPARRGVPLLAVLDQAGHQGGRDRLPADRLALLPQQDQALVRVQVPRPQRQRAAAAAGGLGVQPQEQRVQLRVIARRRGDLVDLAPAGCPAPPGGWTAGGAAWPPSGPGCRPR